MITASRRYIDGLCTALTQEGGIKLEEGKNWSVDVKHRKLIYPAASLTRCTPEEAKGLLIHEVGHLLYTAAAKTESPLGKKNPIMHDVHNAFEDIRIESKLSDKYGAFADAPLLTVKRQVVAGMPAYTDTSPVSLLRQVLSHTIIFETIKRTGQKAYHHGEASDYRDKMTPDARRFIEAHHEALSNIAENIVYAKNINEVKAICDSKAYPLLAEFIDKIPKQEQEVEKRKGIIKDHGRGHVDGKENPSFSDIPTDNELDALLSPHIDTLARQLGQILKERRATRLQGLHRTGRLLSRNAYKVVTGETRILSRRNVPDKADYKIILCLDSSGSMNGSRHVNAYIGAYLLVKTFKKLGFPVDCIKFSDDVYPVRASLDDYRDFEGGGNNDAGALECAIKQLDDTRENIILMLSDGSICTQVAEPVETIKRRGALLVGIGVGIDTPELKKHYGEAINIPEVSELPIALISLLKRLIHR
jgi:hypothetical protein